MNTSPNVQAIVQITSTYKVSLTHEGPEVYDRGSCDGRGQCVSVGHPVEGRLRHSRFCSHDTKETPVDHFRCGRLDSRLHTAPSSTRGGWKTVGGRHTETGWYVQVWLYYEGVPTRVGVDCPVSDARPTKTSSTRRKRTPKDQQTPPRESYRDLRL